METYGDTVPGVHKRDGVSNVGNLLTVVMSRQWLIRRVGRMRDVTTSRRALETRFSFRRTSLTPPAIRAVHLARGRCDAVHRALICLLKFYVAG